MQRIWFVIRSTVALLAEGVGRNPWSSRSCSARPPVALLAEGVGRNYSIKTRPRRSAVALLAEGVGRNLLTPRLRHRRPWSPSSRRAWVEISGGIASDGLQRSPSSRRAWVEIPDTVMTAMPSRSPSSRRAWVEIRPVTRKRWKNSSPSSRRAWVEIICLVSYNGARGSRPPRGGRG